MVSYKEKIKELFELSEFDSEILSEDECETLLSYLDMYNYVRTDRSGWTNPPISRFYELIDASNRKAEIHFMSSEKEVLLDEYTNEKKNTLLSKSLFASKIRYDFIPERDKFGVIYTYNSYKTSEYIKAENYDEFLRCVWQKKDLPSKIKEFTLCHQPASPDYLKIMNIRYYAFKLREKEKATSSIKPQL